MRSIFALRVYAIEGVKKKIALENEKGNERKKKLKLKENKLHVPTQPIFTNGIFVFMVIFARLFFFANTIISHERI